jgi:hypothetical protein
MATKTAQASTEHLKNAVAQQQGHDRHKPWTLTEKRRLI